MLRFFSEGLRVASFFRRFSAVARAVADEVVGGVLGVVGLALVAVVSGKLDFLGQVAPSAVILR